MTIYRVIYNPQSGKQGATRIAKWFAAAAEKRGHVVRLAPTERATDARDFAFTAMSDVVVAVGGDGTINQVAEGLVARRHPPLLGILPAGTVNNLAKVLHIPLLIPLAIAGLLDGTPQPLDIGLVNGQAMISTLTLGVLANAALSVTQQDKQRFGPLIYLTRGLKVLLQHQHWQLTLTAPQQTWQQDTSFVLVTMTNSVGGFTNFAPQAKPGDGLFHVFVAPKTGRWHSLMALPYFLSGNFAKLPGMTYFTASQLEVSAGKSLRSRIDGDPSTSLPLRMQVVSGKVQVLTPGKN
ncbi:diacylglycerol/lipid kinase family protein [Lacticaseibacillus mingshuiensis]|uniref:diacylglycerol/lipid kinase family protein n=1 Tax=Lacticaseibacillus mingshuiensis TaxID=2799574 RepID=UPI00194F9ED8|nr:diacylglycerol kinase family protein [Lacticaseibacillus mingshuiensis]